MGVGIKGVRALIHLPVLFAAYEKWKLFKSQNAREEGFLRLLKALLPKRTHVVIVADRGFARTELAPTLQEIGLGYVIRVSGQVTFVSHRRRGPLDHLRLRAGRLDRRRLPKPLEM